jgi:hypothetical protein
MEWFDLGLACTILRSARVDSFCFRVMHRRWIVRAHVLANPPTRCIGRRQCVCWYERTGVSYGMTDAWLVAYVLAAGSSIFVVPVHQVSRVGRTIDQERVVELIGAESRYVTGLR